MFWLGPRPRDMAIQLRRAVQPGDGFKHEYDFGSTAHLQLKVIGEQFGAFPDQPVTLIARTPPPQFQCIICEQPAVDLCKIYLYEGQAWFGAKCAQAHEDYEHSLLPIVHSPRMGVWGYWG